MFVENLRKFEQGQITGTVNFLKYDRFKELVDFIERAESLKLAYKVPFKNGEREYLKNINIQSLTKSQIQTNGVMNETIVFDCLSLWYEQNTVVYNMEEQEDELRWDFKWNSKFTDYNVRSLSYINNGHVDAPVLIEMNGPVVNPIVELYVEGELYQKVPFSIEIEEYEKLLYGTKENEFYINKQNTDGTLTSLFSLDYIDFENDNVIRLPKNKSCELRLKADNEILNAQVTILAYYKAV
jgi:hypothetical protein|nr:MAG TPA: Baseplate protein [Caudoviricetes sp.]